MLVQIPRSYHCIGCGRLIGWDGKGIFAYTCLCGAIVFADQDGHLSLPASLVRLLAQKDAIPNPPHIDYYLGFSNYLSVEKQNVYDELVKLGCIWSWECSECKDPFLERKRMEIKYSLLPRIELHPALKALL